LWGCQGQQPGLHRRQPFGQHAGACLPHRGGLSAGDVIPNREGFYAVRTRGRKVRAGALEVRWDEGALVCRVDGRWRAVEDLTPPVLENA
jgi:hypothetical protein